MPLTPTEKIWMDGELVDWADATVHVLTHTMHYGSGVFEGIRAYPTSRGVAVFRLREHIERLLMSAKVFMIDVPYTADALMDATRTVVRVNGLDDGCYIRPLVYLGYGEMGLNPIPCPVNVSIAAWPWGTYLGDEGVANGVSMKISSWRRHDPNAVPDRGQGNRDVRELVAGQGRGAQGRLRRGHPARPRRQGQRVHRREHLHRPKGAADHAAHLRQRGSGGDHPGLGHHHRPRPRLHGGQRTDHPHRSLHRRRGFPDRHGRRSGADPVGGRPPGGQAASPARSPRSCSRPTSPPCGGKSTSTRTGSTMSSDGPTLNDESFRQRPVSTGHSPLPRQRAHPHPPADAGPACPRPGQGGPRGRDQRRPRLRPARPARGGRRLRHHPAGRLPAGGPLPDRGRQAAGGRATRPPRGHLHRRRVAGGQPQGRGVLRPGPDRALPATGRRWWPSGPPVGPGSRPTPTRPSAIWSTPRPRRSASWPSPRRCTWSMPCAPRSTRRWPWWPTRSTFLRANDLRVFLDAEHFFDGYKANPAFATRILRAAEEAGAETLVLCDTNGGTLPYEVERIVGHVLAGLRHPGRCPLPQRQRVRGGQLAGRGGPGSNPRPGMCERVRRTGRQHRPVGCHPRSRPQAAGRHHPLRPADPAHPGRPPHRRAGQHRPQSPTALRGHVGLRPQGGAPHLGHRPSVGRLRAHLSRPGGQRDPLRGVGDGRAIDPRPQGRGAGPDPRLGGHVLGPRLAQATRVRGVPLRGGRRIARAAAAGARPDGCRTSSSSSPTG